MVKFIDKRHQTTKRKLKMNYVLICKRTQNPIDWAVFNQQPIDPSFGYWIVQGE